MTDIDINDTIQELRTLAYPQKSHSNAGRKPLPPELRSPNQRYCVWINPALAERVRELGNGSISRGVDYLYTGYANTIY